MVRKRRVEEPSVFWQPQSGAGKPSTWKGRANGRDWPGASDPSRGCVWWIPAVLCGSRCFACDQSLHEVLPGSKDNVGADGVEILKETFARPKRLACLLPECVQAVAGGVEGEGQQVHSSEHS